MYEANFDVDVCQCTGDT